MRPTPHTAHTAHTARHRTATRSVRAMGCRATVTVAAARSERDALLDTALARLGHLERCWSRFLDDSDICRLNRAEGAVVAVDPATVVLVREMAAAVRATAGRFDPTLLSGPVGVGPAGGWSRRSAAAETIAPSTWIDETLVDPDRSLVAIPAGIRLDAGAIGKGLAADLLVALLHDAGASGARIVIGGDLRVTMPTTVAVNAPSWLGALDRITLVAGGVATSGIPVSTTPPTSETERACPVLDPRTRQPLDPSSGADVVQVTVVAGTAAQAEVLATAVLVDPAAGPRALGDHVAMLAVRADGSIVEYDAWRALRADPCPRRSA